ncbi:MAG: hypothetical protein ABSD28_02935 [Tepidisphaeraceae bacterium]|jgi:hypothetical protein
MTCHTLQPRSIGITTIGLSVSLGIGSFASAQALPGEALKFQQLPLGDLVTNPTSQFPGHDELSTASVNTASKAFTGTFAADDFSDNVTSPIVDVQWWGSYLPNTAAPGQVQHFLISFETDVPANSASGFSQPGQSLSSQVVTLGALAPASGTFTETPQPSVAGGPDGQIYQYNAELANPFPEQAGTTYWLKIVALTTPAQQGLQWGWHNRDYTIPDPYAAPPGDSVLGTNDIGQPVFHYLDDAVTGDVTYIPGVPPPQQDLIETNMSPLYYSSNPTIDGFGATGVIPPSEDLAFNLYYNVPEPVGLPLLATGFFLFRRNRRRA